MTSALWNRLASLRFAYRAPLKTVLFYTVVLLAFYPNPLRLVNQLRYWYDPEPFIRTDFPALAQINRELDAVLPPNASPALQAQCVQKYVYLQVRGMSDLDNWGVLDYSPDAATVWERRRGDCEDQAVLAVSILRSRGIREAMLVGNMVHMWVAVDTQEIMGPLPERTYAQDAALMPALPSRSTLLTATAAMLGGFPVERSMLILLALIVLCYHPCRDVVGFLQCFVAAALGFALLREWSLVFLRDTAMGITWQLAAGLLLLAAGVVGALCCRPEGQPRCS